MTERTDRELLELAAKAAGIAPDKSSTNGGGAGNTGFDILGNLVLDWHDGITWNPLEDDGDALRLAVSCDMTVCADGSATVSASSGYGHARLMATMAVSECGDNKNSAVRRAIVRVAAAMAEGGEHG